MSGVVQRRRQAVSVVGARLFCCGDRAALANPCDSYRRLRPVEFNVPAQRSQCGATCEHEFAVGLCAAAAVSQRVNFEALFHAVEHCIRSMRLKADGAVHTISVMLPTLASWVMMLLCSLQSAPPRVVTETWPDGKPRAEYQVLDVDGAPQRSGSYREWHPDGQPAVEGQYSKGARVGLWTTWRPDGQRLSRGKYVADKRAGKWTFWSEGGAEDPTLSGDWAWIEVRHENGALRACGYERDGARHGSWTFQWPDGAPQCAGEYRNGVRQGEWVFRHADGAPALWLISGVYDGGERTTFLSSARWNELAGAGEQRASEAGRPAPPATPTAEKRVGRGAPERLWGVLAQWSALDLSKPEGVERSAPLHRAAAELAGGSSFGWPTGIDMAAATLRPEVVRSWRSLIALTASDARFWSIDVAGAADDASSSPRALLGVPPLDPLERPRAAGMKAAGAFAARFAKPRDPKLSGGPNADTALREALAWLAGHQHVDGRWSALCKPGACPCAEGSGRDGEDIGVTALALLALMGDGNSLHDGPYAANVARGVGWLLRLRPDDTYWLRYYRRRDDGTETSSGHWMVGHALATLALCEAYGLSGDPTVKRTADVLVRQLSASRNPYSGWRYHYPPTGETDTFVTTWAALAMAAANEVGLAADRDFSAGALQWFGEATNSTTGRVGYMGPEGGPGETFPSVRYAGVNERFAFRGIETNTAGVLWCSHLLGQSSKTAPFMGKQLALLVANPPRFEELQLDLLYVFFGANALFQLGSEVQWQGWMKPVDTALLGSQRKDGASRGSWDPNDAWGAVGGRVYTTAISALTLEVRFRRPGPAARPRGK